MFDVLNEEFVLFFLCFFLCTIQRKEISLIFCESEASSVEFLYY